MDHKLVLDSSSAALYTLRNQYHYIFEGHKVIEYQTGADVLNGPGA